MPKKTSTHGASAPSKSKTARSKTAKDKSKDKKAAPRKEARKAASEAASKRTSAAAEQGGIPRRSRSRSLSPEDRPNPRFTYRDHSPGAESPVFDIPMITGSESDVGSPGSTKDPTPSQDAPSQDASAEEEGAVTEPQQISNDLDVQQERYQAAQLQGAPASPTPMYPHGYYPPDTGSGSPMFLEHLKAPRGLNHGRTSRGAYERALAQDELLFVNDIESA
ncbi:ABC Superfamily, partial [Phytophthora palmivora]